MSEQYIKIKEVRNGYLVEYNAICQETGNYAKDSVVFEEKEDIGVQNYGISKEKIRCFKELVEFLENVYGLDFCNPGDHYLHTEIKLLTKNE